jgi:hypothetical protein
MRPFDISSQQAANVQRATQAISVAANRTGVDFDYLMNQARVESGFRADAKAATSSASGLFQFTRQTWLATMKEHGAAHGYGWAAEAINADDDGSYSVADPAVRQRILALRNQPEIASLMAAEFAADNRDRLATSLGREPEPVDLYLAHFLGVGGAGKFLKAWQADPDQPAAPLFPAAAGANPAIFYGQGGAPRALHEIRERFRAKMGGDYAQPTIASSGFSNAATQKAHIPATLRSIEPMPQRLSMDFARSAYDRLASLGGGRA